MREAPVTPGMRATPEELGQEVMAVLAEIPLYSSLFAALFVAHRETN